MSMRSLLCRFLLEFQTLELRRSSTPQTQHDDPRNQFAVSLSFAVAFMFYRTRMKKMTTKCKQLKKKKKKKTEKEKNMKHCG